MTDVRALFAGMIAACGASVLYVLAMLLLPLLISFLSSRDPGAGGAASVVSSGPVLLIAVVAFTGAFHWQLRRASARRSLG